MPRSRDEIKANDANVSTDRWIAVNVGVFEHDVLARGPFDRRSAWLWMIANAAWKAKRVNHKCRPIELQRGQLLAGRAYLAETWQWTEKQVRIFLDLLKASGMVALGTDGGQSRGHFANVITICNYEVYQTAPEVAGQSKVQSGASAGEEKGQTFTTSTTTRDNNYPQQQDAAREAVAGAKYDFARINVAVAKAAGRAMRTTSASVHDISPIIGCLDAGADLDLDVLPTIERVAAGKPAGSLSGWGYFAKPIAEACAKRKAAATTVATQPKKLGFVEYWDRQAAVMAREMEGIEIEEAETNKLVRLMGDVPPCARSDHAH